MYKKDRYELSVALTDDQKDILFFFWGGVEFDKGFTRQL